MKVVLDGVHAWRHDLAGCLHACMATLLASCHVDPLEALGGAWGFYYLPDELRREEYYYPCRPGTSLLENLAPYHPVRSSWREPADAAQGWRDVRDAVAAGHPVAVAVDNFYLPFRPAYTDVHTNHLLIVYGFDDDRRTVRVLDAVPPHFDGDISQQVLTASRDSGNQARHDRDMFFTNQPIANRWLRIEVGHQEPPCFDLSTVRGVLAANLRSFCQQAAPGTYEGLAGEAQFLGDVVAEESAGKEVCDELFLVAGTVLANTALHADWLAAAGARLCVPALAELARHVERVAHHWSAVRIMAALTRTGEVSAGRLARRRSALLTDHERALAEVEYTLSELSW